jgi:glycosyltransferase involved in cell wall biosynthesis
VSAQPVAAQPALSIAIPAYNEEETVEQVVREADAVLAAIGQRYEILLVDDGSRDRTAAILDRLVGEVSALRVIHHPQNRGFSGAMRTCLWQAEGELVFLAPADGQARLEDIQRFLELAPQYDFIFSYRIGRQDSVLRRALSVGWYTYLRVLFGTTIPEFSSTFLFRREALQQFQIEVSDNAGNMLPMLYLQAHLAGKRVGLVGTIQYERTGGVAKGNSWRNFANTTVEDLHLWWKWRGPIRRKVFARRDTHR